MKKTFCLLSVIGLFTVTSAQAIMDAGPYGYGPTPYGPMGPYGYGYGMSNDNPMVRGVDNHYDKYAPVDGYARPPQRSSDFEDPYHAQMEAKTRELNLKKMDSAIKNVDREDRADGRRETRDRMYTGREGLGTVDKTSDTVRNVHQLIRSFR